MRRKAIVVMDIETLDNFKEENLAFFINEAISDYGYENETYTALIYDSVVYDCCHNETLQEMVDEIQLQIDLREDNLFV